MPRRALVLDYGGVLYRPAPGYHEEMRRAIARFLAALGARATDESIDEALAAAVVARDVQHSLYHAASVILARHGLRPSPGRARRLASLMRSVIVSNSVLDPGAVELINWAHSRGVAVGVLSNTWCGVCIIDALERDGLLDEIDALVTSDAIGYRKPRREAFEAILSLLSADPRQTAYIDDEEANVEAARGAGIGLALRHDGRRLSLYIPLLEGFYSSR